MVVDAGLVCQHYHHNHVRELIVDRLEGDEMWSFCYAKEKNVRNIIPYHYYAGTVWTWLGMDRDTKLMVSWHIGDRGTGSATEFMEDVYSRITNRVQLSTDGHKPYIAAVARVFGTQIDYGQVVKNYRNREIEEALEEEFLRLEAIVGSPKKEETVHPISSGGICPYA